MLVKDSIALTPVAPPSLKAGVAVPVASVSASSTDKLSLMTSSSAFSFPSSDLSSGTVYYTPASTPSAVTSSSFYLKDQWGTASPIETVWTGGNANNLTVSGTTSGYSDVSLGNGSYDSVALSGTNNAVSLGNGDHDSVTGSTSSSTITLGAGNYDNVNITGDKNTVMLGNGDHDTVSVNGNGDSITAGTGAGEVFNLNAMMTSLSLNGGTDTINDTSGGTDALQLHVGANGGTIGITNFSVANGSMAHGVVNLVQALASASGWMTADQIAMAVTTDGHGGSLLKFGSRLGSIDFVGISPTSPTHLTANNFQIG